jgi:hypothetical protein
VEYYSLSGASGVSCTIPLDFGSILAAFSVRSSSSFVVFASEVCASASILYGTATSVATCGISSQFSLHLKDVFSNNVSSSLESQMMFDLAPDLPLAFNVSNVTFSSLFQFHSTMLISYTPHIHGAAVVAVRDSYGTLFAKTSISVLPGPPSLIFSGISAKTFGFFLAGTSYKVHVDVRDDCNLPLDVGYFAIVGNIAVFPHNYSTYPYSFFKPSFVEKGKVMFSFLATASGTYFVDVIMAPTVGATLELFSDLFTTLFSEHVLSAFESDWGHLMVGGE